MFSFNFNLPKVKYTEHPNEMLEEAVNISSSFTPEVWIFSAAVLDYLPKPSEGKIPSTKEEIQITNAEKILRESADAEDLFRLAFSISKCQKNLGTDLKYF